MKRLGTLMTIAGAALTGCKAEAENVQITDVCRHGEEASVSVAGYLRLPTTADEREPDSENGPYTLLLVEKANGAGAFLPISIEAAASGEPNHIRELPPSYTYNDLRVITDSGTQVSASDRLLISGRVSKNAKPCVLRVDTVQKQ